MTKWHTGCPLRGVILAIAAGLALGMQPALSGEEHDSISPERLVVQRAEIVREMMKILDSNNVSRAPGKAFHQAVMVLGEFRAGEAVGLLATHIQYAPLGPPKDPQPADILDRYPCAAALAKIGMPVVPKMVRMIAAAEDELMPRICTTVIQQVLGKEVSREALTVYGNSGPVGRRGPNKEAAREFIDTSSPLTVLDRKVESLLSERSRSLIDFRGKAIASLLKVIRDPEAPRVAYGSFHQAVEALQAYRPKTAVGDLNDNIHYLPSGTLRTEVSTDPGAVYPCARALAEIGLPSVRQLEPFIIGDQGDVSDGQTSKRELTTWVMCRVLGVELALKRLKSLGEEHTTSKEQKKIGEAMMFAQSVSIASD